MLAILTEANYRYYPDPNASSIYVQRYQFGCAAAYLFSYVYYNASICWNKELLGEYRPWVSAADVVFQLLQMIGFSQVVLPTLVKVPLQLFNIALLLAALANDSQINYWVMIYMITSLLVTCSYSADLFDRKYWLSQQALEKQKLQVELEHNPFSVRALSLLPITTLPYVHLPFRTLCCCCQ